VSGCEVSTKVGGNRMETVSGWTGASIQFVNHMGENDELTISACDLQRTDSILRELEEAKKRNRRAVEITLGFKPAEVRKRSKEELDEKIRTIESLTANEVEAVRKEKYAGLVPFFDTGEMVKGGAAMKPTVAALSQVTYDRSVMEWCRFLLEEHGFEDIFLKSVSEDCKTLLLSMFMIDQKKLFKSSPSTAGIRKWFTDNGQTVDWLNSNESKNMRQGRHLTADEKKDLTDSKVKVCVPLQMVLAILAYHGHRTLRGEASPFGFKGEGLREQLTASYWSRLPVWIRPKDWKRRQEWK